MIFSSKIKNKAKPRNKMMAYQCRMNKPQCIHFAAVEFNWSRLGEKVRWYGELGRCTVLRRAGGLESILNLWEGLPGNQHRTAPPWLLLSLHKQSNSGGLHYSQLFAPFLCKWIMLHPVNIKLGQVTCFDQWNASGRDMCQFQIKALTAFAWFHHLSFYSVTMARPRWVLLGQPGS